MDGSGSARVARIRFNAPAARTDAYRFACRLERSAVLAPWSGSEVATGSIGEAMVDDATNFDRMFYRVKVEIRDR